ncbi:MAG: putative sensor with domain [Ilumatobacteraceae bacterium]|nr:putative sensor with domain [Ilumatobacteraceae bacterium]
MFDDLKIRNKLILLMAGPIAIILLLSALGAQDRREAAAESRDVAKLVTVARLNSDVADALQQEALYSSAYVGSDRSAWEKELKAARANSNTVMDQALPVLQEGLGGTDEGIQTSAGLAVGAADKLGFYRESVDQGFRPDQVNEMVVSYGDLQNTFLAVNTNIADAMSDPQASAELRSAAALAAYKSSLARQGALLAGAAETKSFGSDKTYELFQKAQATEKSQLELLNSLSGLNRKGAVRNALATDQSQVFDTVREAGSAAKADGKLGFEGKAVVNSTAAVLKDLHTVESDLLSQLIADSTAARDSAERASNFFLLAALIAIGGAVAAAMFLGRRITKPLGRLTDAADHLSGEQMPRLIETLKNPSEDELGFQIGTMTPIDIDSNDEIGQLARSFNEVQRVAGEVANEQAQLLRKGIGDMFVNLARRNQALLDRQIEFIDELERGEEDPDQLENLYRLDHLATRMRRNAESLLVLAGAEPPRRRGRPAPLANVVRAALAEVEDFGRIELLSFDEVLVASNAAADLAHLLSELMENATNFSPPETRVEVVGHKTKADGYVISVTDHGIGMSPAQITEANDSLARPPLVGLAMSRSLGFIVVGRLASRHGIAVRMMPSAAGGVTAVVSIPPALVVDTPGGMAEPQPTVDAPARLKPVLDSPTSGLAPLTFNPADTPAPTAEPAPSDAPAPALFAPPAAPAPSAPLAAPPAAAAPVDASQLGEPVAWPSEPPAAAEPAAPAASASGVDESALPTRSIFDDAPPVGSPLDDAESAMAARVDEAVSPAVPAALSFEAPESSPSAPIPPSVEATGASRLDGPPPRAPQTSRPFFLEDAEPPRAFGRDDQPADAPPTPAPSAPAPARLFGGPSPSGPSPSGPSIPPETPGKLPGRSTNANGAPPAPLTARRPAGSPPPAAAAPEELPGAAALAAAPAAEAPPVETPVIEAPTVEAPGDPVTTSSGLAKRVPRSAGASRAIPGSETERGVAATRRSPEEIRKMLAQHSAGRQRARVQESVPAGAPDEKETHE